MLGAASGGHGEPRSVRRLEWLPLRALQRSGAVRLRCLRLAVLAEWCAALLCGAQTPPHADSVSFEMCGSWVRAPLVFVEGSLHREARKMAPCVPSGRSMWHLPATSASGWRLRCAWLRLPCAVARCCARRFDRSWSSMDSTGVVYSLYASFHFETCPWLHGCASSGAALYVQVNPPYTLCHTLQTSTMPFLLNALKQGPQARFVVRQSDSESTGGQTADSAETKEGSD